MVESGNFYSTFIDPILTPLRKRVAQEITTGQKVIDIACGTGAQLFEIAKTSNQATGIDLAESMISYAEKKCRKLKLENVDFHVADATNLAMFLDNSFDVATLSLALHQFHPNLYTAILSEMKRVSSKIIIVDYAVPLPKNYAGIGSRVAEFLAGREHNNHFKQYYKHGGLHSILPENNLIIEKSVFFAKGAFQLVVCA